jgi:ribosomal protein L28
MRLTIKQELHREYLRSPLWREIRQSALDYYRCICGKCGKDGNDVHHLTYKGWGGNERISDLQVLCRDCHSAIHAIERATKNKNRRRKRVNVQALFGYLTEDQRKMIELEFGGVRYSLLFQKDKIGEMARVMAKKMLNVDDVYFGKRRSKKSNKTRKRIRY